MITFTNGIGSNFIFSKHLFLLRDNYIYLVGGDGMGINRREDKPLIVLNRGQDLTTLILLYTMDLNIYDNTQQLWLSKIIKTKFISNWLTIAQMDEVTHCIHEPTTYGVFTIAHLITLLKFVVCVWVSFGICLYLIIVDHVVVLWFRIFFSWGIQNSTFCFVFHSSKFI